MGFFNAVVPYLANPLTFAGVAILAATLAFYGLLRAMIASGHIPVVSAAQGARLLHRVLLYGLIVAVLVIVLGFAYAIVDALKRDPKLSGVPVKITERTLISPDTVWKFDALAHDEIRGASVTGSPPCPVEIRMSSDGGRNWLDYYNGQPIAVRGTEGRPVHVQLSMPDKPLQPLDPRFAQLCHGTFSLWRTG